MKYSKIIDTIYQSVLSADNLGKVPTYIPELAQVNPDKFGVYFYSLNKQSYGIGDCDEKFSAQSISKVLALSLAYRRPTMATCRCRTFGHFIQLINTVRSR